MTIRLAKLMHQPVYVCVRQCRNFAVHRVFGHLPAVAGIPTNRILAPPAQFDEFLHVVSGNDISYGPTAARNLDRLALGAVDQFTETTLAP